MNGKKLEEVDQFKHLRGCTQTENGQESKDQTGATTLSHDKASDTMDLSHHHNGDQASDDPT